MIRNFAGNRTAIETLECMAPREFHQSVRDAYLALARTERRYRVIDAAPDPETVARSVWDAVEPALRGGR